MQGTAEIPASTYAICEPEVIGIVYTAQRWAKLRSYLAGAVDLGSLSRVLW